MLPDVLTEMRQHLEDSEATMLEIHGDKVEMDSIDVLFRAFHTIKGIGGFMQLETLVKVAHRTETLLDDFRKGYQTYRAEFSDLLFRARDLMSSLVDMLEGGDAPRLHLVKVLSRDLEQATVGETGAQTPTAEATDEGANEPEAATNEAAPTVEDNAANSTTDDGPGDNAPAEESDNATVKPTPPPAPVEATKKNAAPPKRVRIERTVKVGTARLDTLVDMVGELVIAQQMVMQDESIRGIGDEHVTRTLNQVTKITRDWKPRCARRRHCCWQTLHQRRIRHHSRRRRAWPIRRHRAGEAPSFESAVE